MDKFVISNHFCYKMNSYGLTAQEIEITGTNI